MIRESLLAAAALAMLSGCSSKSSVSVTSGGGGAVQTAPRSEPIYYNGQHYNVNYTYNEALNLFDMKVSGTSVSMTPKDKNTASAIATSALRYFACPDKMSSSLVSEPKFSSTVWSVQAKCG